jgi:hypothetical protein
MKKLITLSIAFAFLASNVSSANYVLYYKSSQYSNWVKVSSYADFVQCENARKYQYNWAYESRCNSE